MCSTLCVKFAIFNLQADSCVAAYSCSRSAPTLKDHATSSPFRFRDLLLLPLDVPEVSFVEALGLFWGIEKNWQVGAGPAVLI